MGTLQTYDIADRVRLEVAFQDDSASPIDPDSIVLGIRYPTGASATYTYTVTPDPGELAIVRDEEGLYHFELTAEHSGKHDFRWVASGPGAGAEEGYFWVSLNKRPGGA